MQREEMSAVRKLCLSEGVGAHNTGRVGGALAARNSSASSTSAEPQVSSIAPAAVDFFLFSCFPSWGIPVLDQEAEPSEA